MWSTEGKSYLPPSAAGWEAEPLPYPVHPWRPPPLSARQGNLSRCPAPTRAKCTGHAQGKASCPLCAMDIWGQCSPQQGQARPPSSALPPAGFVRPSRAKENSPGPSQLSSASIWHQRGKELHPLSVVPHSSTTPSPNMVPKEGHSGTQPQEYKSH